MTLRRCDEEDALVRAKLRVRCGECGGGAILLGQDPGSWDDVLRPHRIQVRSFWTGTGEDDFVNFTPDEGARRRSDDDSLTHFVTVHKRIQTYE